MRYYISDQHFCHDNLNGRVDCRGFESGFRGAIMNSPVWRHAVRTGKEDGRRLCVQNLDY